MAADPVFTGFFEHYDSTTYDLPLIPGHVLLEGLFAKVRVADVINCQDGEWKDGYGPLISSRHFDFVIVGKYLRILAAIELDDKSHERPERIARDKFLETAMEAAGVPLIR